MLFDKGRGAGGRMATRRVDTSQGAAVFDHGAQYFTARDPAFQSQTMAWEQAGVVAAWPAAGADAWVGTPGMNGPAKHLAQGLDITWSAKIDRVERVASQWHLHGDGAGAEPFDTLLLAVPSENAGPLVQPWNPQMAELTPAAPCWTVMCAFAARVPHDGDILRPGHGPVGWAARNSAKPGRSGPEAWVIQASPAWSSVHLEEDAASVIPALLAAFGDLTGDLPTSLSVTAHRWRYARSGNAEAGMRWDPALRLGICGDWLLGPRVECAWLSGTQLAEAV